MTSDAFERPRVEWAVFALLLVLAAVLRLYRLGFEGYWVDEVFSLQQAPSSPWSAIAEYWSLSGGGRPLALVPLSVALRFGETEFLTRLPYAILSVVDVGAVYFAARKFTTARTAAIAMAFVALSPLHIWYAQEVRWYSQWCLLTTLSFLALVHAWDTDRRSAWGGYLLASVLNLYTFVLSIFVLAVQVASTWMLALRGVARSFLVKQHAVAFVAAVLALPAFGIALGLNPTEGGAVVGTPRSRSLVELPYTFFAYVVGFSVGPTVAELHRIRELGWIVRNFPEIFAYAAVFGSLFFFGLWAVRNDRRAIAILVPWALGLPLVVFLVSMIIDQTYNVRYAFPGLPGFMILLAIGVGSLSRAATQRVAGGLVVLGLALSLANYYWNPRYDKEDVRGAVEVVRESRFRDAPVAFIGQGVDIVRHYGPRLDVRYPISCDPSPERGGPIEIEGLRGSTFWLIVSRDWTDRSSHCLERFEDTHKVVGHDSLVGTELWRIERESIPRQASP